MLSHMEAVGLKFLGTIFIVLYAGVAFSCPAGLFMDELNPRIEGPRSGLRMFVKHSGHFSQIPLQVDPVDNDGRLMFFDNEDWRTAPADKNDMLTFDVAKFGEKIDYEKDQLPCRGPITYQLRDKYSMKFGYVTNCGPKHKPLITPTFPVSFDGPNHTIKAKNYSYIFNSDNYMQFKSISFRNEQGREEPVAQDSELLIHADIKNFWSMDFDSDEIVSKLEASRLGPVGDLARVSFYLKVMMFKIDLELHTNVGFYEDSGHIPMMVSIPVDARSWLNHGSGILYSWKPTEITKKSESKINMPALDVDLVKKGVKPRSGLGLKYCKADYCYFDHATYIEGRRLSLDFGIEKKLVAMGFFPMFVDDVGKYKDKMKWDIKLKDKEHRIGVYFEVSGMPEGGHPWDFWLSLGDKRSGEASCPHPVRYHRVRSGRLKGPVSKIK
jgi:hypothetical protein